MLCFVFRIALVQFKMIRAPSTDLWMSHVMCGIQADLFFRAERNIVCGPARGALRLLNVLSRVSSECQL